MGSAFRAIGRGLSNAAGSVGRALGGTAGSTAGNLLGEVVVTAPRVAGSALGSSLGSAVGAGLGSAALNGALTRNQTPAPAPAPANRGNPNDTPISELTVTGNRPPSSPSLLSSLLPALGAGAMAMSGLSPAAAQAPSSVSNAPQLASLGNDTPVDEITVEGVRKPQDYGLGGLLTGGGGVDTLGENLGTDTLQGVEDEELLGEEDKTDEGLMALLAGLGLSGKDLLGMGLMAAIPGLMDQGGGGGGPGTPQGGLEDIAKNNQNLANMLSAKAQAGMNGQIGGQGLNTIRRQVRRAQAAIRQRYSQMGMSGSSAEASDLNAAAQAGVDMQFDIGQKMATTGLQAVASLTGQSANAYAALLNAQTQRDTQLGNALANFAGAVAGRLFT